MVEDVEDLFSQLTESDFWGSVKFTIKGGKIVSTEIVQTVAREITFDDLGNFRNDVRLGLRKVQTQG